MITIVQLTDLHLRPRGQAVMRIVESAALTRRAVAAVLALRPLPDAVIVSGDIADTPTPQEYEMAREILAELPMPVYAVPGNHDGSEALKSVFPEAAWTRQSPEGSLQFAVEIGPVLLLGLDSNVPGQTYGEIGAERLAFARAALAAAPDRPTMIAVHHPPIATGMQSIDAIGLRDAAALAALVREHPQVGLVVSGHVHRGYAAPFAGAMAIVAPSVCHQMRLDLRPDVKPKFTLEPPAFLVHVWSETNGFASHTAYVESYPGPFDFTHSSSGR